MAFGVFLTAFALMFLEILATRVLGIVEGPETVVYMVAIAMLGLGAAGSWLSVRPAPARAAAERQAASWVAGAGLGTLGLFLAATALERASNAAAAAALSEGGFDAFLTAIVGGRTRAVVALGAVLSVPYFLMGGALVTALRGADPAERPRLYGADLLGAALGCLAALGSLELSGYALPLALALGLPFAAAAAFAPELRVRHWICGAAVATTAFIPVTARWLEPQPAVHQLARLYDEPRGTTAEELEHTWDSYSRVAKVRISRPGEDPEVRMALGEGEGHAQVRPYRGPEAEVEPAFVPGELALASGVPRRVLVLFAGAGQDLVALDAQCRGQAELVGVELNRHIVGGAMSVAGTRLEEFFALPRVHFHVAEAREYLERDRSLYDAIILSWSGASLAYYTGAAGFGPRFVYTYEGYSALLDHLTPDGRLVVLNTSKVKALATLRPLLEARGAVPARSVVILGKDGGRYDWRGFWDENRLVVKPSGFSADELTTFRDLARKWSASRTADRAFVLKYPGETSADGQPFADLLAASDPQAVLRRLNQESGLEFVLPTDDRPFVLDVFPPTEYLEWGFWRGRRGVGLADAEKAQWNQRRHHAGAMAVFFLASLGLILGPLLVARKRLVLGARLGGTMLFFGGLGTAFMLVEVGFVQKLSLFLGHPGRALAVVLGAIILFSGLGSLASTRLFRSGLGFRSVAVLAAISSAAVLASVEFGKGYLLSWPLTGRIAATFLLLAPPAFFMGQLFPQALARIPRSAPGLLPWALALNALTGTLTAGAAVIAAQTFGYSSVVLAGVVTYVGLALVPPRGSVED